MPTDRHACLTALLRYVRIAFSLGCGILCLLLIVFWVRSFSNKDVLTILPSGNRHLFMFSEYREFGLGLEKSNDSFSSPADAAWGIEKDAWITVSIRANRRDGRCLRPWCGCYDAEGKLRIE
jgi:hypothetical protein